MNFVPLTSHADPAFERAMGLYRISFPAHEHREIGSQRAILSNPEYHFDLVYDGGNFVGLMLYWESGDFLYVEHFCIEPDLRGKNYGSAALRLLAERGKSIILEIDPLTDERSIRRKCFYERAGFRANPFEHVHPPYREGVGGHGLIVMSSPGALSRAEYDAFADYLKNTVMARKQ
ncbi:MAG: GNAT family N-acetyltransferase [Clostridia bacterium]|nr:GNAT family N-acetyltransferase [Clostridia bacterium]